MPGTPLEHGKIHAAPRQRPHSPTANPMSSLGQEGAAAEAGDAALQPSFKKQHYHAAQQEDGIRIGGGEDEHGRAQSPVHSGTGSAESGDSAGSVGSGSAGNSPSGSPSQSPLNMRKKVLVPGSPSDATASPRTVASRKAYHQHRNRARSGSSHSPSPKTLRKKLQQNREREHRGSNLSQASLSGGSPAGEQAQLQQIELEQQRRRRNSALLREQTVLALEQLPVLRDAPQDAHEEIFVRKLELCRVHFNFRDPSADIDGKELKRQALLELVDFISTPEAQELLKQPGMMEEVVQTVSANIFRALPPQADEVDPDEDEPVLEVAWPHLQVVYELLLRFIVSREVTSKVAKRPGVIDQTFCLRLLTLFDSEDPRERDYLKTILHRLYGKFMSWRSFIRKQLSYIFQRFVFDTERHNGIAELLEILGSIINGFALPINEFLILPSLALLTCRPSFGSHSNECTSKSKTISNTTTLPFLGKGNTGGTPRVPQASAHSPTPPQVRWALPPAAFLLHCAVCRKGSRDRRGGHSRDYQVLASGARIRAGPVPQ